PAGQSRRSPRPIESRHDLRPRHARALASRSRADLPQSRHGRRAAAPRAPETAGAPRRDRAVAVALHAARAQRREPGPRAGGSFVGARPQDLVFVPNVTVGINAVLASVPLTAGDEVLITELAYGAVKIAAKAYCDRAGAPGTTVSCAHPIRDSGDIVEAIVRALSPRTKIVVLDHVPPQTRLVLPVAAVAAECRRRGVAVLVDGAHVPGSRHLDI